LIIVVKPCVPLRATWPECIITLFPNPDGMGFDPGKTGKLRNGEVIQFFCLTLITRS